MAHDNSIRFRCRALFEVLNMTLSSIAEQETIGLSTLSDWKNDDRKEYGGIWLKGCKAGKVNDVAAQLREELQATSVYDEMKNKLSIYHGITDTGEMEVSGILDLSNENKELQMRAELDVSLLSAVGADWFDAQLLKNSLLSSIVLNNQMKKDVTKIKQSDIKASSEIHKIAKEARFGKAPETVIFNANGNYSPEELNDLTIEQLEQLAIKEHEKIVKSEIIDSEVNTQVNT